MGVPEEQLLACRARLADARAELARVTRAYFAGDETAAAYRHAQAALASAERALFDARVAAAVGRSWLARPALYRERA